MSESEPQPRTAADLELMASAFQQAPAITVVLDGPQLRIAAWNTAAAEFLGPLLGDLGASVWEVDWIEATGAFGPLRRVLESGEPYTGHSWRLVLPDTSGQVREVHLDFTYTPWRRSDGTVRGIIGTATDMTLTSTRQLATEAKAASWRERFEVSHDAMIALQAALLPATVPVVPGLQIAARYVLADADTSAGGDWFSAYPTTAGQVALVVGDVVGHGVAASAAMGQLRAVIKERLRSGAPLSAALQALDQYAATLPDADAATICAALMDPSVGELEYCTAGHPPPLVVHDGGWRYLEPTGAGPLGSGRGFATARVQIPNDALLLLYSDGLIERPGIARAASTAEVGRVVADALGGRQSVPSAAADIADRVCEQSLDLLTRDTGFADDITVLAVHRVEPVADLSTRLVAQPGATNTAAARLEGWLDGIGAGQADRLHLRHAVLEVVANSVEHGLAERDDGIVEVTGHLADSGEAEIDITDNGEWKEPGQTAPDNPAGDRFRGLGLPLARQLLDRLTIRHDQTGTQVRIVQRLNRPAPIIKLPGSPIGDTAMRSLDEDLRLNGDADDPNLLSVHGPLLSTTAERLQTRLDIDSRAGTRSLTVNLDEVTHLTSAAVRVLQQAQRAAHRQGQQLILTARPGTIAHEVLHLLGLPSSHAP